MIGVDPAGHKDILGIWPGNGDGESAKLWFACLTVKSLDPKGTGQTRWGMCWKPTLNTFADRMPAASTHQ